MSPAALSGFRSSPSPSMSTHMSMSPSPPPTLPVGTCTVLSARRYHGTSPTPHRTQVTPLRECDVCITEKKCGKAPNVSVKVCTPAPRLTARTVAFRQPDRVRGAELRQVHYLIRTRWARRAAGQASKRADARTSQIHTSLPSLTPPFRPKNLFASSLVR